MKPGIRVREQSSNENVSIYRIPNSSRVTLTPDTARQLERFLELWDESTNWERGGEHVDAVEARVSELRNLRKNVVGEVEGLLKGSRRSAFTRSEHETTSPWRSGSDNYVYLDSGGKYVYKYSTQEGRPENVLYLRHKYQLLKKYLGSDLIPQTVFFLVERIPGFTKKTQADPLAPRTHAASIQRYVPGKTFREMTVQERTQPEVISALRVAHKRYTDAKKRIAEDLRKNGFSTKTLDLRLEIGSISDAHELTDEKFIGSCESPNIIYNPGTRRIYFMDFGRGFFGGEQQNAFKALMASDRSAL